MNPKQKNTDAGRIFRYVQNYWHFFIKLNKKGQKPEIKQYTYARDNEENAIC